LGGHRKTNKVLFCFHNKHFTLPFIYWRTLGYRGCQKFLSLLHYIKFFLSYLTTDQTLLNYVILIYLDTFGSSSPGNKQLLLHVLDV
jgi:hypothetical protein